MIKYRPTLVDKKIIHNAWSLCDVILDTAI